MAVRSLGRWSHAPRLHNDLGALPAMLQRIARLLDERVLGRPLVLCQGAGRSSAL
jgi:hypothetical protein